MDECNKDCAYWQEGESNCKILTYKNCPEKCIWKQTRAERRHKKRAIKARIYSLPEERKNHILAKYYRLRSKMSLEGNE